MTVRSFEMPVEPPPRPHLPLPVTPFELAVLIALLLLGAALRFYQLGLQSLWLDEAASVAFASGDLDYIMRFTFSKEPNPPLYYIVLHYWMDLFGDCEVSVRFPSALAGSLSLPIVWLIGRRLFGRTAGLAACFAMVISPFHIWLSQEARAFALLTLMVLWAAFSLHEAARLDSSRWWLSFFLASLMAMYLHLFGFIAIVSIILASPLLGFPLANYIRQALATFFASLLLYLPWLHSLLNQFGEPQWRSQVDLIEMFRQALKTLPMGEQFLWDAAGKGWLVWSALLLVAVFTVLVGRRARGGLAFIVIWFSGPLLISWVASFISPIFAPRYLIVAAPALYLIVGLALERLWNRHWLLAAGGVIALIISVLPVLHAIYTQPLKEDFRGAAGYLRQQAQPDEPILLMAGYIEYAFLYYGVDGDTPLGDVADAQEVKHALEPLSKRGDGTIWFAQSHYEVVDPGRHTEKWVEANCYTVDDQYFTGIRLRKLQCP